jgi:hypothetical protein
LVAFDVCGFEVVGFVCSAVCYGFEVVGYACVWFGVVAWVGVDVSAAEVASVVVALEDVVA